MDEVASLSLASIVIPLLIDEPFLNVLPMPSLLHGFAIQVHEFGFNLGIRRKRYLGSLAPPAMLSHAIRVIVPSRQKLTLINRLQSLSVIAHSVRVSIEAPEDKPNSGMKFV